MFFEGVHQPGIEAHFFSVGSADEIRLAAKQTLARRKPDEIFRRLDLAFEVFVLGLDVIDRFRWGMSLSVTNEDGVRVGNVVEEILDRCI